MTLSWLTAGEVKEKGTAHKEYKQAISEGHGAYLMDQAEETPVRRSYRGRIPPSFVLIAVQFSRLFYMSLIRST